MNGPSLIACYLKANKPKSKIMILDASDSFIKQDLFMEAWKRLYPGMIEWVPAAKSGKVIVSRSEDHDRVDRISTTTTRRSPISFRAQRAGADRHRDRPRPEHGILRDRPGDLRIKGAQGHLCARRCHHRRRNAEIGIQRQQSGQSLRPRHPGRDRRKNPDAHRNCSISATALAEPDYGFSIVDAFTVSGRRHRA